MRAKNHILSILNADLDFFSEASSHLDESVEALRAAFSPAVYSIIYAINIQCALNRRTEEICKIAKECTSVNFNASQFTPNAPLILKGNGVNSELFGNKLSVTVDIVSQLTGLKSRSVNRLYSLLSPVILSYLYYNYKANNLTEAQLTTYLETMNREGRNHPPREVKNALNALIRDDVTRSAYNTGPNFMQAFQQDSTFFLKGLFRNIFRNGVAKAS